MSRRKVLVGGLELSDYARRAKKEAVVVTQRGKPVAAVVAVDPEGWTAS